jgi:hypothetical protein
VSDIQKMIEISGSADGFAAALQEAENQARTAAARLEQLDKALDDRRRQREEAEAQRSSMRQDAVIQRGLDARIANLSKEEDALRRSLDRQQTAYEKAEARVTEMKSRGAVERVRIAQKEQQDHENLVRSFAGRAAQGAARAAGPPEGLPVPFLGGGIAGIGGALIGAAAVFTIKKAITDTLEWTTAIKDLMLITREGAKETSTFAAVAERFGIDANKLQDTLRNVASAAAENPEHFRAMGIELNNLDGSAKSPLQLFMEFRKTFQGATQDTHTLRAAQEILGRSYADLLPLLNATDEQMKAWTASAADSGKVLTTEALEANLKYQQSLAELGIAFEGIGQRIGQFFIPKLAWVAETAAHAADVIGGAVKHMLSGDFDFGRTLAEADRLAGERAERANAAAQAIIGAGTGTGQSLPTRKDVSGAQRAADQAIKDRIALIREEAKARVDAMNDALRAFERERDAAIRTIEDEHKARQKAHHAQIEALKAEMDAQDEAFRARERARDDATAAIHAQLDATQALLNVETARKALADAEKTLAHESRVVVTRRRGETDEDYQGRAYQQDKRVKEAAKALADEKAAIARDAIKRELEDRIKAIEAERVADRRQLEDKKHAVDVRVAAIQKEMALDKEKSDARVQHIRDEQKVERERVADAIKELERQTAAQVKELELVLKAHQATAAGVAAAWDAAAAAARRAADAANIAAAAGVQASDALRREGERNHGTTTGLGSGGLAGPSGVRNTNPDDLTTWTHVPVFDSGGTMVLREPTLLVGERSQRVVARAAVAGDEAVSFGGVGGRGGRGGRGGATITVNVHGLTVDEAARKIGDELERKWDAIASFANVRR